MNVNVPVSVLERTACIYLERTPQHSWEKKEFFCIIFHDHHGMICMRISTPQIKMGLMKKINVSENYDSHTP